MKRLLLYFSFQFVCQSFLFTQSVYFEKSWGGSGYDYARSVRQLANGDIYVLGFSSFGTNGGNDFALTKLDRFGNILWTKYFGDSLDENGLSMDLTLDGNLILSGEMYRSSTDLDAVVYKVDTSGTEIWSKRFGETTKNESLKSVIQTTDSSYVLCGFKSDASGSNDLYLVKLNQIGDTLWTKTYGGSDNDYGQMIREVPGGRYVTIFDTKSFGAGGYDVGLLVVDAVNGNTIWAKTYGDTLENGSQGLRYLDDGNLLCWGETTIYPNSPFDFYLEKMDTAGNSIWKKVFGGVNADAAFSVAEDVTGDLILTGYSNSYNVGPIDLVVIRTDSTGSMKWVRNYGSGGIEIGYEIIPSVDNGYFVCGQTNNGTDDFYLLHLDTSGMVTGVKGNDVEIVPLKIFPNPCSGFMILDQEFDHGATYSLATMTGLSLTGELPLRRKIIFPATVQSGIYLLTVNSMNREYNQLVILNRE